MSHSLILCKKEEDYNYFLISMLLKYKIIAAIPLVVLMGLIAANIPNEDIPCYRDRISNLFPEPDPNLLFIFKNTAKILVDIHFFVFLF